jgi:hypothetical protein
MMHTADLKAALHDSASYLIGRLARTGTPPMTESEVVHACWTALGHGPSKVVASQNVNGLVALLCLCSPREMQTLIVFLDQWADMIDGGDE